MALRGQRHFYVHRRTLWLAAIGPNGLMDLWAANKVQIINDRPAAALPSSFVLCVPLPFPHEFAYFRPRLNGFALCAPCEVPLWESADRSCIQQNAVMGSGRAGPMFVGLCVHSESFALHQSCVLSELKPMGANNRQQQHFCLKWTRPRAVLRKWTNTQQIGKVDLESAASCGNRLCRCARGSPWEDHRRINAESHNIFAPQWEL